MAYVLKTPWLDDPSAAATVAEWHVSVGEAVRTGEPIVDVRADHILATITAREDGVLRRSLLAADETAPPGTPIGIVASAAESIDELLDELNELDELDTPDAAADTPTALPNRRANAHFAADRSGFVSAGGYEWPYDGGASFGGGQAPTPIDYFTAAFAACLSVSIGVQADIRDIHFDGVAVSAESWPKAGSVESIELTVELVGVDETDDRTLERIVETGEQTCHVAELIDEDVELSLSWTKRG